MWDLPTCSFSMNYNDMCQAHWKPLPDGNQNWDVDNCGVADIFRYVGGNILAPQILYYNPLVIIKPN